MRFHYTASQPNGKIIEGDYEATGPADVLGHLASQGLKPISLKTLKDFEKKSRFNVFGQAITTEDKIFLTKYLALMMKVGTDLFKAIDILIADFQRPGLKSFLIEMRLALEKGQQLHSVFYRFPKFFSPVFVNLIKAGEISGNLEKVFETLSISLQKEQNLKQQIKAAITYPIILLVASIIILFILVGFSLPKIASIFGSGGFEPPLFSKVVFSIGLFIGDYFFVILTAFIILAASGWFFSFKSSIGKKIISRFAVRIPLVGEVLRKIAFQRFTSIFSSLLSSGMPIIESLEITANAVGLQELKDSLLRVSREGLLKGLTIGEAFRKEPVFPKVVVNLISISEKAGHIEGVLFTLSEFYEAEIESAIKSLVSFLEPVLLLGIGLIIGIIALAIIVPI